MKKDQELSMLIGKRMTNRDTMFNEYLYEVLNAAQESGQRMGYAQGRDETAREIFQELKEMFGTNREFIWIGAGVGSIGDPIRYKLEELAIKYGIELE